MKKNYKTMSKKKFKSTILFSFLVMMVLLTSDAIITSNYVNKGSKVSIEEENERYRLNDSNLKTLEDSVHFYEDGM